MVTMHQTLPITSSWFRWIICVIINITSLAASVNRSMLVPLQDQLIDWYSIDDVGYNLLMTLYSWPNILASIICGILIDKFGVRRMVLAGWFLDFIGLSLILYSCFIRHYLLLCFGRTIVGIGNEALSIAIRLYAIQFFNPKEYGIVFAIYCAFGSLGYGLNTYISYQIYELFGIMVALSMPLIVALFACLPLFLLMLIEKYCSKPDQTTEKLETTKLIIIEKRMSDEKKFKLSDVTKLSIYFWVLLTGYILFVGAAQSSLNIDVSFIRWMFGASYEFATSIVLFASSIRLFSFLMSGYITTKIGRKVELLLVANICAFMGQFIYGWINSSKLYAFVGGTLKSIGQGFTYPIVWSAIPLIVDENIVGTAFGLTSSMRFGSAGLCAFVVGLLTKEENGTKNYIHVQYFILLLIAMAIITNMSLMHLDVKYNNSVLRKVQTKQHNENDDVALTKTSVTAIKMSIVSADVT